MGEGVLLPTMTWLWRLKTAQKLPIKEKLTPRQSLHNQVPSYLFDINIYYFLCTFDSSHISLLKIPWACRVSAHLRISAWKNLLSCVHAHGNSLSFKFCLNITFSVRTSLTTLLNIATPYFSPTLALAFDIPLLYFSSLPLSPSKIVYIFLFHLLTDHLLLLLSPTRDLLSVLV